MGFGWLFIGYFVSTMMTVNSFGYLIRPIGYVIMLYAFSRLKEYHRNFGYALLGGVLMLFLSGVMAYDGMFAAFSENVTYAIGYMEMIGSLAFHALLCWAIRSIAKETEMDKISFAATRNFIFFAVYNLLYAIALLPFAFAEEYARVMSVPVLLLYFACLVLHLVLIFSCYMRICDVADVDMAQKPSRFAFINRMRAENEERRAQKEAMFAERARERRERKEKRKK